MDNYNDEYLFKDIENQETESGENNETTDNKTLDSVYSGESETVKYDEEVSYEKPSYEEMAYEDEVADKKKINLGLVSFCLFLGAFAVSMVGKVLSESSLNLPIYGAIESLQGIMFFASFVLMIITRVKEPQNRFGKAVMWLFIAAFIFLIIMIVILIVLCNSVLSSCNR